MDDPTPIRNDAMGMGHATGTTTLSILEMPIMEMHDTFVYQDSTVASIRGLCVSQVLSSDDDPGQWQCLEDAGNRYGFDSC